MNVVQTLAANVRMPVVQGTGPGKLRTGSLFADMLGNISVVDLGSSESGELLDLTGTPEHGNIGEKNEIVNAEMAYMAALCMFPANMNMTAETQAEIGKTFEVQPEIREIVKINNALPDKDAVLIETETNVMMERRIFNPQDIEKGNMAILSEAKSNDTNNVKFENRDQLNQSLKEVPNIVEQKTGVNNAEQKTEVNNAEQKTEVYTEHIKNIASVVEPASNNNTLQSNMRIVDHSFVKPEINRNVNENLKNSEIPAEQIKTGQTDESAKVVVKTSNSFTQQNGTMQQSNNTDTEGNQNQMSYNGHENIKQSLIQEPQDLKHIEVSDESSRLRNSVLNQVQEKVSVAVNDAKQEITMELTPKELGKINIKIVFEDGSIKVNIVSEKPEIQNLLKSSTVQLSDILKQTTGIAVDVKIGADIQNVRDNNIHNQGTQSNMYDHQGNDGNKKHNSYTPHEFIFEENTEEDISQKFAELIDFGMLSYV